MLALASMFGTRNVTNALEFSSGPPLLLGNYTNVHYQSLVPLNTTLHHEDQPNRMPEEKETESTTQDDFIFMNNGQTLVFQSLQSDKLQCPVCGKCFQ